MTFGLSDGFGGRGPGAHEGTDAPAWDVHRSDPYASIVHDGFGGSGVIQRREGPATAEAASPSSGGSALPDNVRGGFEQSFGTSFADVRVHTGNEAPAMGAQAFTSGSDVHFAPGHFDPGSDSGRELIGHELAHVVQQRAGRVDAPQAKGAPINDDPSLEAEADAAGARAARGEPAGISGAAGQPGPQRKVIQRKLGFEFEANWKSYQFDLSLNKNRNLTDEQRTGNESLPFQLARIPKGKAILTGDRFEMQADDLGSNSSDIEFVTTMPPFEENSEGRGALVKTLDGIGAICAKLEDQSTLFVPSPSLSDVGGVAMNNAVLHRHSTGKIKGSPQCTAGLRLDQLAELYEELTNTHEKKGGKGKDKLEEEEKKEDEKEDVVEIKEEGKDKEKEKEEEIDVSTVKKEKEKEKVEEGEDDSAEAKEDLMSMGKGEDVEVLGDALGGTRRAIDDLRRNILQKEQLKDKSFDEFQLKVGSGELVGLVATLATYVIRGDRKTLTYAKNIAPLLARTDFATMFKMLPKEEQKFFSASKGAAFVDLVLDAAGVAGTAGDKLYKHGLNYGNAPKGALDNLTRGVWLSGIAGGTDYLTAAKISKVAGKTATKEMESLGALGKKTEKVGGGKAAPIFELRRMKQSLPWQEWKEVALGLFDYTAELNRRAKNPRYSRKDK